jgi:hypothetical protein
MPREHRRGPVAMSADELAAFLEEGPTGAICVTDAAGHLLALPAEVIGGQECMLKVQIGGFDEPPSPGTPACVVADRFPSYEAIRGVIAQGSIASAVPATPGTSVVTVAVARTVTFSFANVIM